VRILLLEDEPIQLDLATRWLTEAGHTVDAFSRGQEALKAVQREGFDLAVLDWMVPDLSGEEILRWLRMRDSRLPVIFATSRDEEEEIAHILGLGADDYAVKPLRRLEFLARVEALRRRSANREEREGQPFEVGAYTVDPRTRSIKLNGTVVKMTPRMSAVGIILFSKRGELVLRTRLYEEVWGQRAELDTRTVDTHVSRLRSALELDGRHGWRLTSVYQQGYRLEEAAS
jgi:DNA-binding response OmpR family regulator